MIVREFTVGDRLTSVLAKLYTPGRVPLVLGVGDTVVFRMVLISTGAVKINDAAATIVTRGSSATGTPAEVRYDWGVGDVDTAGEYIAWFIQVSGGETRHFPDQTTSDPEFKIIFRAES